MFLPYNETQLPAFVNADGGLLEAFYETIYPASKLIHEVAYYQRIILKSNSIDKNFNFLDSPYMMKFTIEEPIILVRSRPTVNTFTVINLLSIMIKYFSDFGILHLFFTARHVAIIKTINTICTGNPFSVHPSCTYFELKHASYQNICMNRDMISREYGPLLRAFVNHMEGSLSRARSTIKYESMITAKENSAISLLDSLETGELTISEEKLNILKESVGTINIQFDSKETYERSLQEFIVAAEARIDL